MTWVLDEQRRMLRDSAQSFLTERAPVAHLRTLRDANDPAGHSAQLWRGFGEQGYSATLVPEALGGLGLGITEAALIAEQIGHTLAPTPFFSTAVLAAALLKAGATPAQHKAWLPRIAAADVVMALAVDEQSRHKPGLLNTTAAREGGGWRIDGQKLFVIDGHVADALIVAARADGGTALLLVPKNAPGLQIERTRDGRRAQRRARALRGRAGGQRRADRFARDRCVAAGRCARRRACGGGCRVAGAGRRGVRAHGGVPASSASSSIALIGEFQALQHRCAELFCDLELTRAIVRQALQALDESAADTPLRVAQAKARACLTANRAVQEARADARRHRHDR